MDHKAIVNDFLNSYYQTMMTNKMALKKFYTSGSFMSYERSEHRGVEQIEKKLGNLSFKTIQYDFQDYDLQPSPIDGGFVIFVTGKLIMDGQNNFDFAQMFQLLPNNQGGYFIFNDIMRLVY